MSGFRVALAAGGDGWTCAGEIEAVAMARSWCGPSTAVVIVQELDSRRRRAFVWDAAAGRVVDHGWKVARPTTPAQNWAADCDRLRLALAVWSLVRFLSCVLAAGGAEPDFWVGPAR